MCTSHQIAFQNLIKEIRKQKGLTQLELAIKLAKPQSYISKYESGERRLDVIEVRNVCSALGITLEKFCQQLESKLTK